MKKFFLCGIVLSLSVFAAVPTFALTEEEMHGSRTIVDYIKDFVDVPEGGMDWKLFGQTKEIPIEGRDEEGLDYQYFKPEFPQEIQQLDGQEIILKGFMFPLESAEKQSLFLFGPFPMNCPFQYHVGPSLSMEVHVKGEPIEFSYDPVTLKGKLVLMASDLNTGTFYRLYEAREVK